MGSSATATVTVVPTPSALAWADPVHGLFYACAFGAFTVVDVLGHVRCQPQSTPKLSYSHDCELFLFLSFWVRKF